MATNMLEALLRSSSNELMGFAEMPTRFSSVLMLAFTEQKHKQRGAAKTQTTGRRPY